MRYSVTFDAWKLGTFEIELDKYDADCCYHPGLCDIDCERTIGLGYVKEQFAQISSEQIIQVLEDYGVENAADKDRKMLEMYIVWLAAGDIMEGNCTEC